MLFILAAAPAVAQEGHPDAIVAQDGTGQYTTIRAAVDAAPQLVRDEHRRWTILTKPGTYRELLYVQREKRFVRLVGADAKTTTITYDLSSGLPGPDGQPIGTFRTPTVEIDADDFAVENLTFSNTAGKHGPALALRVDGDRVTFHGCRFIGWQDTLLLDRGRHYFSDCDIEGATDFIFGGATVWFERCHIFASGSGYITAASTPDFEPYGFVFNHCDITGATGVQTYLGRPWRDFAKVVFLHTSMSDVVRPAGGDNWKKPQAESRLTYAEFESNGPGGEGSHRVAWSQQLTPAAARVYTPATVFKGWDPATIEKVQNK
ncbi:MAG: pectinesterase family protein [Tepidisphaeraceae bacterium]